MPLWSVPYYSPILPVPYYFPIICLKNLAAGRLIFDQASTYTAHVLTMFIRRTSNRGQTTFYDKMDK